MAPANPFVLALRHWQIPLWHNQRVPSTVAAEVESLSTPRFDEAAWIAIVELANTGSADHVGSRQMTAADFRRIALDLEGVEEYSHAGLPAFRVGGRKFASLASQAQGYGNLMLTLEQQSAFVEEAPEIFLPIPGGWGRMGHTHIRLAPASEDVLTGALRTAWKLRVDKNATTNRKNLHAAGRRRATDRKRGKRSL